MSVVDTLLARNADQIGTAVTPGLPLMPSLRALVLTCADPRVDPALVLGLKDGEAAVVRTVGGRVTPAALRTLALLAAVGPAADAGPQAAGDAVPQPGMTLVVMHHTDCGITRLEHRAPQLLAEDLGIPVEDLPRAHVQDPWESVRHDLDALAGSPLPAGLTVAGLVHDVATGLVHVEVPPRPLRAA